MQIAMDETLQDATEEVPASPKRQDELQEAEPSQIVNPPQVAENEAPPPESLAASDIHTGGDYYKNSDSIINISTSPVLFFQDTLLWDT